MTEPALTSDGIQVFLEAENIADTKQESLTSWHLLLALLAFNNPAKHLLEERGLRPTQLKCDKTFKELPRSVTRLRDKAREIAKLAGSKDTHSVHMLLAILSLRDCLAYQALAQSGIAILPLRNAAMSFITNPLPQKLQKESSSTSSLKIYIVGAGNVGLGLALALKQQQFTLCGMFNRTAKPKAEELLHLKLDVGIFSAALTEADLILVCVSDHAISEIGALLARSGKLKPRAIVAHTSGCFIGKQLGAIPNAFTASIHPLAACPSPERAAAVLKEAFFAIEGDVQSYEVLQQFVKLLNGTFTFLKPEHKVHYHAICVLASNLVVALVHLAKEQADLIEWENAEHLLLGFAKNALVQAQHLGIVEGLTGPLIRGEIDIIKEHLQSLPFDAAQIYRLLSQQALKIAVEKNGAIPNNVTQILHQ